MKGPAIVCVRVYVYIYIVCSHGNSTKLHVEIHTY